MSSGQVQSGAGRWLGHAATALGALATVLGATSWFLSDADGSDLWWHLAAGRHAAEHGAVPLADPFSHTAYGRPWVDHSWLWGRIFWSAYDGHPDLAAALQLGLIVGLFSLVAWNSWRASRSLLAAGAATWLAASACHWFLDVRPHVVTLLFTALLLATLRWRHAHWMWPPLFLLWANLHAGFFFGLALLGLDVGLRSVEALRGRSPLPAAAWAGLVAACLAAAVNPWGFTIYTIPWQPLASTPFQTLIEWMPLSPSLDPRTYEGRFGWMALLAFGGVVLFGRQLFPVALALVTGAMAVRARRFVPLFAVCSAPLVAVTLGAALDRAARALRARPSPALRLAAGVLALVVAAALWQDLRIRPRLLQRWTAEEVFPTGAAAYLQGMPDPPRRLFNLYNWGGYLMLAAPRVPIFIDGRAGTVYADEVVRAYVALATARRGWHRDLESWGIDAVLVYPETPLAKALRAQEPPWRVAYADPRSMLLFPPDARDLPLPRELVGGSDLALMRGFRWRQRGNLEKARSEYLAAQQLDPLNLYAYGELVSVASAQRDAREIERWVDEALRLYPNRSNQIWSFAESAWGAMGRCEEQLDALRRIQEVEPFVPDELRDETRARIRAVEAAVKSGDDTCGRGAAPPARDEAP